MDKPVVEGWACPLLKKIIVPKCPFCGNSHVHGLDKEFLKFGYTPRASHCHKGEYIIKYVKTASADECREYAYVPDDISTLIPTTDIADLLDVSDNTVRYWIKTGKLKAVRIGHKYFVPEDSLVSFLDTYMKVRTAISTYEFAKTLKVSPATVLNWIKKGRLKAFKVHGRFYIPKEEVARILKEGL